MIGREFAAGAPMLTPRNGSGRAVGCIQINRRNFV
ncbi:MAG: hypothetical protein JWL90_2828 [Chthoniobacteraceae bacterium]|nr:hypothetical protein [Chthoniobacteraceae bacterium]